LQKEVQKKGILHGAMGDKSKEEIPKAILSYGRRIVPIAATMIYHSATGQHPA